MQVSLSSVLARSRRTSKKIVMGKTMSLVSVLDISIEFPGKELFRKTGFQVEPDDRIGLVGPNGSGKTTLLRLIAGEARPDRGEIRVSDIARIGYLPQDIGEKLSGPLLQSLVDSVPGRVSIRNEIEHIRQELGIHRKDHEQEKLAFRLAELRNEINHLETRFPPHRAEKILEGLGFGSDNFHVPVSSLSGGWRMRASLGSILFQDPDLLLLDEPTNYLDIPSVRWLEQFLRDFNGAMILVCHDRDFLNRQIQRVISLEPEGVRIYKGNYDRYLKAREEEIKGIEARAKNQEQKIKEAQKFIRRFRAKATKARQAQSKIKLLKKMELVQSRREEKNIRFSFREVPRSGRVVLQMDGISKSFDEKELYKDIDLKVLRGERVAIIGPNGFGKTTLLRIVAGEIKADQGTVSLGHNVTMSYYAQHHSEMLDPKKTVFDEVYQVVPHESIGFVRNVCGSFLFSGDDVHKPVGVLSGGEKARVSLAKILVKPGNLLIMDEPTNHLDLISSETLTNALSDFNGTLLFVSHNQAFINRLATKIWDIRDGEITEYPGGIYDYYRYLEELNRNSGSLSPQPEEKEPGREREKGGYSKKSIRKKKAEERDRVKNALKPVADRISHLENRIARLERREKEISNLLSNPELFKDSSKSVPLLEEYNRLKEELDESIQQWEQDQVRLEDLKRDLLP